jgi:hypothetical protein
VKKVLILFLLIVNGLVGKAQTGAFSVGPMLHLNLGEKTQVSFGLEAAYWNLQKVPAGIDVGVDFQKGVKRFYLEGQLGVGLAGLAAGPVLEKKKEEDLALGWQTNIWANYFAGVNLRWRRVNGQKTFAPGIYAKVPLLFGYDENEEDSDWDDIFDD